ncbi:hypothetical protein R1flu_013827 [Riccia fluitans]|uniref:Fe/B12 periplasmic-binding domain-containing protein n=1 Tax=Riccia fluitans TaxID=41844 RepID=A0ABD1YED4_9MARC
MKTILVAGTNSGVGKTSIALGLMAAFARRGLRVQPFKVGPDFLDPIYHKAATGRESYNLDGWMLSREVNLACFMRCIPFTDIAIVEGVMGLYDGRDGKSDSGSTAEMAKLLDTPVLLVLDCWALARSAAAVIRGYTSFDPDIKFAGVLFNKVGGTSHTAWLTEAISATEPGIRVLGGVPKSAGIELPGRHLGVHLPTGDELEMPVNYIHKLAELIEIHVDLDAILKQSTSFELTHADLVPSSSTMDLILNPPVEHLRPVRIGVARDDAFCFYYHENLLLLQSAGAELVEFSPLRDTLPPRLDGIYFGGGYPELYLEELSSNTRLLYGIRAFANAGGVIFGEGGGLMYLAQGIEDEDQQKWSMCGVFPFWTRMQHVMHMGYVTVTPQENCVLFPASVGEIRGQIYHFCEMFYANSSAINLCAKGFITKAEYQKPGEDFEGFMYGNTMVSFVHLHFGSNPSAAQSLVERCRMDTTKAAAVAAASASAVAAAGPVAAAAAGAAAASAVAEAMGESKSLVPYQSVSDYSALTLRRTGSFDLGSRRKSHEGRRINGRLVRSESEIWVGQLDQKNGSYSKVGGEIIRSNVEYSPVASKAGFASTKGKGHGAREDIEVVNSKEHRQHGDIVDSNSNEAAATVRRKNLPPLTSNRRASGWLMNGEVPKHLERVPSGSRFSSSSPSSRALPERIVSLSPSATEILIELGAGRRVIGVTEACVRPNGIMNEQYIVCRSKLDPGSRFQTHIEIQKSAGTLGKGMSMRLDVSWLCKAKPDLIIIQDSSLHGDTCSSSIVGVLAQAGLESGKNTNIMILKPNTVADVLAGILDVGDRVGLYHEACLLGDWLRSRLRKAAASVARLHRPRVLVLHAVDPFVLGGHWVPEMVSLAGGLDALQRPGCNAESVIWRRIINYAPEVLIFALVSSSLEQTFSEVGKVSRFSGFWSLPAVEAGRVYICEHFFFSSPGPKLVDGVEILTSMVHPSAPLNQQVPGTVLKLRLTSGQTCSPDQISKHFQPY